MKFKLVEMIYDGDKRKNFTDGKITKRLKPGDEIPDGFYPGRTFNVNPWNKGLTKDTDERVKINSEKSHATRDAKNYPPWNKGLTKETDSRVKGHPGESNGMYGKHPDAWNKGLTKETDPRMKKASDNHKGAKPWNKGLHTGSFWTETSAAKRFETQKKNNTLGINQDTKIEKEYYEILKKEFPNATIEHPYLDKDRYPYKADFYVQEEDLFIEVHGNWTHGGRPYDPNDIECQKQLARWQEKAKTSKYYQNAIYTWTDLDVRKVEAAKKNNLNFRIIYGL